MGETCNIVWQLERWDTVLDIDVEYVVVFFSFVELFAT
jgi:hypothetical protein